MSVEVSSSDSLFPTFVNIIPNFIVKSPTARPKIMGLYTLGAVVSVWIVINGDSPVMKKVMATTATTTKIVRKYLMIY